MLPYTHNMPMEATYWAPLLNDAFGNKTFDTPITIACRWQNNAVLFVTPEGKELTSSAIVYPAQEVVSQGYLALGDLTGIADPKTLAEAYEIRQVQQSPSLDAVYVLYKAYL